MTRESPAPVPLEEDGRRRWVCVADQAIGTGECSDDWRMGIGHEECGWFVPESAARPAPVTPLALGWSVVRGIDGDADNTHPHSLRVDLGVLGRSRREWVTNLTEDEADRLDTLAPVTPEDGAGELVELIRRLQTELLTLSSPTPSTRWADAVLRSAAAPVERPAATPEDGAGEPDQMRTIHPNGWRSTEFSDDSEWPWWDDGGNAMTWVAIVYHWPAEPGESATVGCPRPGLAPEHWTWEIVSPGDDGVVLDGTTTDPSVGIWLQRIVDVFHADAVRFAGFNRPAAAPVERPERDGVREATMAAVAVRVSAEADFRDEMERLAPDDDAGTADAARVLVARLAAGSGEAGQG